MIKNILGVVAGFLGGSILQAIFRKLSAKLYPLTEGFDPNKWEDLLTFHAQLPTSAYLLESASFILSTFLASYIAAKLAQTQKFNLGLLTGLILSIGVLFVLFNIPNPIWVVVLDILGILIAAFLGSKFGAGGVPDYDL